MENGISKAVRLAGSQTALATVLGLKPQAVQKWVEKGLVPGDHCLAIEEHFERQVTRYELNPKIYGTATDAHAALASELQVAS